MKSVMVFGKKKPKATKKKKLGARRCKQQVIPWGVYVNSVTNKSGKTPVLNADPMLLLEKELTRNDIKYSKPDYILYNFEERPDFVIPKYQIAIFCDASVASTKKLDDMGWNALHFQGVEIKNDLGECIETIQALIMAKHSLAGAKHKFTFVDLFSGIGGFRVALDRLGGKCLGFSEIDSEASKNYKLNFVDNKNDPEIELGDITKLNKLPFQNIDLIVGGVPCQSWSVAGKMRGFDDPRGKLWGDALRIIKQNRPRAFIFENVKGLIDPRNSENLKLIIRSFVEAGYNVPEPSLLNSYDFGVPQNRDRVFIVGFRKDISPNSFSYPGALKKKSTLSEIFDEFSPQTIESTKKKFDLTDLHGDKVPKSRNRFQKEDELNDFFVFCDTRNGHTTIHSWDVVATSKREKEICMTILRNRRKKTYGTLDGNPISFAGLKNLLPDLKATELEKLIEKNILRQSPNKGYVFVNSKNSAGINGVYRIYLPHSHIFSTLTATGTKDMIALQTIRGDDPKRYKEIFLNKIYSKNLFRPITSREAGRLQGFPFWFAVHPKEASAKKQFGNAVSVPVVYALGEKVISAIIGATSERN